MKTIQEIYQQAELAMNACNLPALVTSWASWQPVIRRDAEARGIEVNQHPVNQVMADKIQQLAGPPNYAAFERERSALDVPVTQGYPQGSDQAMEPAQ